MFSLRRKLERQACPSPSLIINNQDWVVGNLLPQTQLPSVGRSCPTGSARLQYFAVNHCWLLLPLLSLCPELSWSSLGPLPAPSFFRVTGISLSCVVDRKLLRLVANYAVRAGFEFVLGPSSSSSLPRTVNIGIGGQLWHPTKQLIVTRGPGGVDFSTLVRLDLGLVPSQIIGRVD